MKTRVKIFTFVSGHGETLVDPPHEERINQWLDATRGDLVNVTQSESVKPNGSHVTICVWYSPKSQVDEEI